MDGGSQRQFRVLLVEDDHGDAFLVRELLAEVEAPVDLTVVPDGRGGQGDTSTRSTAYCWILSLPDGSGLATLRKLLASRPHVAVCVLTGLSDEHLGEAALAHGAQDYLVKGRVDGVLLERAIRYAVERRAGRGRVAAAARGRAAARPSRPGWSAACCRSR